MTDEQKKPYHTIMVSAWRLFIKERAPKQFSQEWWNEIIGDYNKLREQYKNTQQFSYCDYISQSFLDEWERIQKRDRQDGVSEGVLLETQGYHQEELQFTDPVSAVGGSEEVVEPFT